MEKLTTTKETTIKDFLEVIFRRKWIILGLVSISTALVIYLNLKEPAVYESSGKILVKRGEATGVFNNYVRTLTWEEEISSQIEMVKSEDVIQKAGNLLAKFFPEGYSSDQRIDPGRVGSGVITKSNVLFVTYTGMDPIFCEAAVNAIIYAYKDYYQQIRTPPEMEDFFSQEMTSMKEEIEYWRDRKMKLESEWGIVDIDAQRRISLARLDKYRFDLEDLNSEVLELEDVIENLKRYKELELEEKMALSGAFIQAGAKKTVIDNLNERLMALRMEESEMSVSYTSDYRELQNTRQQIENVVAMLDREIRSIITVKRTQLGILKAKVAVLEDLISEIRTEMDSFPAREVELNRINTALARVENGYTELVEQHISSRISTASNPEWSVTIISRASRAYQKKVRDYVRIALGPFFSLIVSLGFAFFMDNLDHSIKNVSEAEEALGFHVLASFPDKEI